MKSYPEDIRFVAISNPHLARCAHCGASVCEIDFVRKGVEGRAATLTREVILTGQKDKTWLAGDWHRCDAPKGRRSQEGGAAC